MSGSLNIALNSSASASPPAEHQSKDYSPLGSKVVGIANLPEDDNGFLYKAVHHGITISSAGFSSVAFLVAAKYSIQKFSIKESLLPTFIGNIIPTYINSFLNPDTITPRVVKLINAYGLSHITPPKTEPKTEL